MNKPYIRFKTFEGGYESSVSLRTLSDGRNIITFAKTDRPSTSREPQAPKLHQHHKAATTSKPSTARRTSLDLLKPLKPPSAATHTSLTTAMAEQALQQTLRQLHQALNQNNPDVAQQLLSRAKIGLLQLNALIPTPRTPKNHLLLARETLELGALASIRSKDAESFTRYFQQLQPFYTLPSNILPAQGGNASKITGLYLLLLLSQGDYAGFHTLLEGLETVAKEQGKGLEEDAFVQYPVRLEQALMEGSYDRVWGETKGERVPSPEFSIFSEVLIGTIRSEIASCSEKAYPSIPISDAKSLLFLDSEGSVVSFARERGWAAKDGRIYFPQQEDDAVATEKDILSTSGKVIENTLGYARELETIV